MDFLLKNNIKNKLILIILFLFNMNNNYVYCEIYNNNNETYNQNPKNDNNNKLIPMDRNDNENENDYNNNETYNQNPKNDYKDNNETYNQNPKNDNNDNKLIPMDDNFDNNILNSSPNNEQQNTNTIKKNTMNIYTKIILAIILTLIAVIILKKVFDSYLQSSKTIQKKQESEIESVKNIEALMSSNSGNTDIRENNPMIQQLTEETDIEELVDIEPIEDNKNIQQFSFTLKNFEETLISEKEYNILISEKEYKQIENLLKTNFANIKYIDENNSYLFTMPSIKEELFNKYDNLIDLVKLLRDTIKKIYDSLIKSKEDLSGNIKEKIISKITRELDLLSINDHNINKNNDMFYINNDEYNNYCFKIISACNLSVRIKIFKKEKQEKIKYIPLITLELNKYNIISIFYKNIEIYLSMNYWRILDRNNRMHEIFSLIENKIIFYINECSIEILCTNEINEFLNIKYELTKILNG